MGEDELFRDVFAQAPIPQATVSDEATFTHINAAGCELVGYEEQELVGRPFADVIQPESLVGAADAFLSLLSGAESSVRLDVKLRRKNGAVRDAEIFASAVVGADGQPRCVIAMAQDVTAQRERERRFRHLAAHDGLTELPNRAWFTARLGQAVARAKRQNTKFAVFFVDLDEFKPVNDDLGHDAGDQVLFSVAGRLDRLIRPGDTLARYGGDEFTILCEDLPGEHEATEIASRIVDAFGLTFRVSEGDVHLTSSVGVALCQPGAGPSEDIIRAADHAMYDAKRAGRNRFRLERLAAR